MEIEFRPFRRFPGEIRDMIWDRAIRPYEPGVHIFTAFGLSYAIDEWVEHKHQVADEWWRLERMVKVPGLAAPQDRQQGEIYLPGPADRTLSWTQNNPSTYLIDGGLWTACKESYLAMKRRFHGGRQELRTGSFIRQQHRNATHYQLFTTYVKRDLFIFQMPDLQGRSDDAPWIGLPAWYSFGIYNVAFEYDPEWRPADAPEEPDGSVKTLTLFTKVVQDTTYTHASTVKHGALWFVDYALKRAKHVPISSACQKSRGVFYGSDCRFVEVLPGEASGGEASGGDTPWFYESPKGDSLGFLSAVSQDHERLQRRADLHVLRMPELPRMALRNMKYGVLACEYY